MEGRRDEELFTRDELETIFTRRQNERRQLLEDAKEVILSELRPTLEAMTEEIGNANHVKKELGDKLDSLAVVVTASNNALLTHGQLAAHTAGQKLVDDLGLAGWSLEEKRALHPLVTEHLAKRLRRADDERRTRRRQNWLIAAGSVGACLAALLGGLVAKLA